MGELEFSQTAQQWVNVVLIWVGFGTLAGLLAKSLLPGKEPVGAVATLVTGVVGSTIGLFLLTHFFGQLWNDRPPNPISPLGFLAATAGALAMLILYRLILGWTSPADEDAQQPDGT